MTPPVKPQRRRTRQSPVNYVNNKVFTESIVAHQIACREARARGEIPPRIPEALGLMFFKIATHRATAPDFSGYTFKEDMIADAAYTCLLRVHSFNPEKSSNAFAYYTTVVRNAFIQRIKQEKREFNAKAAAMTQANIFDESTTTQDHDTSHYGDGGQSQNVDFYSEND